MIGEKTRKLVYAALFAALTCVMTMIVKIPVPATGGYVNLGDCVVLLAGWVLGPMYGGAAAGLGSMLADLVSGYPLYAPGTFVIKACMAVCAWAVFRAAAGEKRGLAARIGGALAGEAVMAAGYFAYEGVVLGFGLGAAAAIPGNLIQGVFGLAVSVAAAEALSRSGAVKERWRRERLRSAPAPEGGRGGARTACCPAFRLFLKFHRTLSSVKIFKPFPAV